MLDQGSCRNQFFAIKSIIYKDPRGNVDHYFLKPGSVESPSHVKINV